MSLSCFQDWRGAEHTCFPVSFLACPLSDSLPVHKHCFYSSNSSSAFYCRQQLVRTIKLCQTPHSRPCAGSFRLPAPRSTGARYSVTRLAKRCRVLKRPAIQVSSTWKEKDSTRCGHDKEVICKQE